MGNNIRNYAYLDHLGRLVRFGLDVGMGMFSDVYDCNFPFSNDNREVAEPPKEAVIELDSSQFEVLD